MGEPRRRFTVEKEDTMAGEDGRKGEKIGCGGHGVQTFKQTESPLLKKHLNVAESHRQKKDIVPEPVEPGGVHPELGGQVDSQGQSAVH